MVGKLVEKEVLESPFSLYSNWFFFLLPGLCSHFTSLLSGHTCVGARKLITFFLFWFFLFVCLFVFAFFPFLRLCLDLLT